MDKRILEKITWILSVIIQNNIPITRIDPLVETAICDQIFTEHIVQTPVSIHALRKGDTKVLAQGRWWSFDNSLLISPPLFGWWGRKFNLVVCQYFISQSNQPLHICFFLLFFVVKVYQRSHNLINFGSMILISPIEKTQEDLVSGWRGLVLQSHDTIVIFIGVRIVQQVSDIIDLGTFLGEQGRPMVIW